MSWADEEYWDNKGEDNAKDNERRDRDKTEKTEVANEPEPKRDTAPDRDTEDKPTAHKEVSKNEIKTETDTAYVIKDKDKIKGGKPKTEQRFLELPNPKVQESARRVKYEKSLTHRIKKLKSLKSEGRFNKQMAILRRTIKRYGYEDANAVIKQNGLVFNKPKE
jgi:hypothetical protein